MVLLQKLATIPINEKLLINLPNVLPIEFVGITGYLNNPPGCWQNIGQEQKITMDEKVVVLVSLGRVRNLLEAMQKAAGMRYKLVQGQAILYLQEILPPPKIDDPPFIIAGGGVFLCGPDNRLVIPCLALDNVNGKITRREELIWADPSFIKNCGKPLNDGSGDLIGFFPEKTLWVVEKIY